MRVYLVDDDQLALRMMSRLLRDEDFECEELGSASVLLSCLNMLAPSCVLLDIGMPDVNGLDALRQIVARTPLES